MYKPCLFASLDRLLANPRQLACAPRPNMGANVSAAIQETLDHAERHLFPQFGSQSTADP